METKKKLNLQQEKLPYAKYYYKELEPISAEKQAIIEAGAMDPKDALSIFDRNQMLEAGYLPGEMGYCVMEDGAGFMANLTFMPNVTAEMFSWWFAWHALEDVRYKIWNPGAHSYARNLTPEKIMDSSVSILERNWGCTHDIVEDIGFGDDTLQICFVDPSEFGFDKSKIFTEYCSGIQTGNGFGEKMSAVMLHMVRDVPGGVELRSRFWIGYHIVDQQPVKLVPPGITVPEEAVRRLFIHNCVEFTNLAAILPSVYAENSKLWK